MNRVVRDYEIIIYFIWLLIIRERCWITIGLSVYAIVCNSISTTLTNSFFFTLINFVFLSFITKLNKLKSLEYINFENFTASQNFCWKLASFLNTFQKFVTLLAGSAWQQLVQRWLNQSEFKAKRILNIQNQFKDIQPFSRTFL